MANDSPRLIKQITDTSGEIFDLCDPNVPAWAKASTKPTYTADEVGAIPMPTGYGDLSANVYVPTVNANNEWYKATASITPGNYKIAKYDYGGYLHSTTPSASDNSTKAATTAYVQSALPTKVSDLTNDSNFISGLTILSYGSSTWNDFITAYNAQKIVYCRASSGADPATGSQVRLAFMAYVNDASTPTEVEFQYYRSVSTHSDSQQGDQIFIYKLNSSGTWSVMLRSAFSKIEASTGLSSSYSNGTLTITNPGALPAVTSSDNGKFLQVSNGACTGNCCAC